MENKFISSDEFLKTYDWRKLRQTILNKYGNKCMCCGATPSDDIYMCVDHIRPRKTNPELALDENNLQVLCNVCVTTVKVTGIQKTGARVQSS